MREWLIKENPAWGDVYIKNILTPRQVAAIYTKQNHLKARRSMESIRAMLTPKRARNKPIMNEEDKIL